MDAHWYIKRLEFRSVLTAVGALLFLGLITSYIFFQARFLVAGPQIALTEEPAVVHNDRVVTLTGNAHNITHLWLNDRQIFTDESGNFREALVLENGYTVATLKARDRFGRETRVIRPFVYTPVSIISTNL